MAPLGYSKKKLEAAQHKFQRRILGSMRKESQERDNQSTDKARKGWRDYKGQKTEMAWSFLGDGWWQTAESSSTLGVGHNRAETWKTKENWNDTIRQDLEAVGMTWKEAQQLAASRKECRRSVAQCVFDTRWAGGGEYEGLRRVPEIS